MLAISSILITLQFQLVAYKIGIKFRWMTAHTYTKAVVYSLFIPKWTDHSNYLKVTALIYLVHSSFVYIFIICEPGHNCTKHFEYLEKELGDCDWYFLPIGMRRMYKVFLANVQNSVAISSYGSITCDRETCKKVFLSNSGSVVYFSCTLCIIWNSWLLFKIARSSIKLGHTSWRFVILATHNALKISNSSTRLHQRSVEPIRLMLNLILRNLWIRAKSGRLHVSHTKKNALCKMLSLIHVFGVFCSRSGKWLVSMKQPSVSKCTVNFERSVIYFKLNWSHALKRQTWTWWVKKLHHEKTDNQRNEYNYYNNWRFSLLSIIID